MQLHSVIFLLMGLVGLAYGVWSLASGAVQPGSEIEHEHQPEDFRLLTVLGFLASAACIWMAFKA